MIFIDLIMPTQRMVFGADDNTAAESESVNIHSNAALRGDPSPATMEQEGDRTRRAVSGSGADSLDEHSNAGPGRGIARALARGASHNDAGATGAAARVSAHARVNARTDRRRTGSRRSGVSVGPPGVAGKHGCAARTHRTAAWPKRRDAAPRTNRTSRHGRHRRAATILVDRDGGGYEIFGQGS